MNMLSKVVSYFSLQMKRKLALKERPVQYNSTGSRQGECVVVKIVVIDIIMVGMRKQMVLYTFSDYGIV